MRESVTNTLRLRRQSFATPPHPFTQVNGFRLSTPWCALSINNRKAAPSDGLSVIDVRDEGVEPSTTVWKTVIIPIN